MTHDQKAKIEAAAIRKAKRDEKRAGLPWGGKKKRRKLPSVSKLEKNLWATVSAFIRLRDTKTTGLCFYCERAPIQCAMHRIKRGKRATKYDERNLDGGCHACNWADQYHPQKFDAIFIRKKGADLFLELEAKSRETSKRTRQGILELTEQFRTKLAGLGN